MVNKNYHSTDLPKLLTHEFTDVVSHVMHIMWTTFLFTAERWKYTIHTIQQLYKNMTHV